MIEAGEEIPTRHMENTKKGEEGAEEALVVRITLGSIGIPGS